MIDLAVVGLGALGSAISWHAARLGLSVVGFDRHHPPHTLGSTHAETRITRLAVGEGEQYLPFVARSHELWRELEALTGEHLLHESGGYIVSEPSAGSERWSDFTRTTARIAHDAGIGYELVDPAELRQRQPNLTVPDDAMAGYEPTAGVVMCERAVDLQLRQAVGLGADLRFDQPVVSIEPHDGHVVVRSDKTELTARNVIVAAGAWMPDLAPRPMAERLRVTRQVVYWFEVDDLSAWSTERFPFVMWIGETIDNYSAAFPVPPASDASPGTAGVKVLGEQFVETTDPAAVIREVTPGEIEDFHQRLVAPRFKGISDRCVRAEVCLYTNTPDDHFVIEADPRSDRIVSVSAGSGHGFKHSAALGEALAHYAATGTSELDLSCFGLGEGAAPG